MTIANIDLFASVTWLLSPSEEISVLLIPGLGCSPHNVLEYLSVERPRFNIGNSFRKFEKIIQQCLASEKENPPKC